MPVLLDGKKIRDEILAELRPRVEALALAARTPGLAVVLAGGDPASAIYVKNKIKACGELGISSVHLTPPETVTTDELLAMVAQLNARPDIDGILVQMPLPKHVDAHRILLAVAPDKDVDGFHPCNIGNMVSGNPGPRPCTPSGVMELLRRYRIAIAGKRAVVVGRSDIVGKPMAMLLLHAHATVTICHSKTVDLAAECRRADILVAAIGRPALIRGDFIKLGATVIDVGMNRLDTAAQVEAIFPDNQEKQQEFLRKGSLLLGDVHPLETAHAGAVTPVPGGVGPLTIAMLMANTVASAEQRLGRAPVP
ncbi:MAG: bifunctional methylenetetrahydrofolate dehydrogenase/methenyltetrahydrofolate cyclohydrolase FolD [Acidobacteriia bacterium]|nr:bifunctional methylenetetrahydrofolate dehydrogenase/methenyltetrahydrofolate cyclohydrolase FolD [Terriglobia bacterium]